MEFMNRNARRFCLSLLCLVATLLVSCASEPYRVGMGRRVPVRDVLYSGETEAPGYGAYGYLVFTRRPGPDDSSHYYAVCEAFNRNLESVDLYGGHERSDLMPTYWLIQGKEHLDTRIWKCSTWLASYDYAHAKVLASAVGALSKKGPVLVAWRKPFGLVQDEEEVLVLDLSDFADDDIDRAFRIWMDRITRDPDSWKSGFNLVMIKESFRSFLERYGEQIISAIKTVKDVVG